MFEYSSDLREILCKISLPGDVFETKLAFSYSFACCVQAFVSSDIRHSQQHINKLKMLKRSARIYISIQESISKWLVRSVFIILQSVQDAGLKTE